MISFNLFVFLELLRIEDQKIKKSVDNIQVARVINKDVKGIILSFLPEK